MKKIALMTIGLIIFSEMFLGGLSVANTPAANPAVSGKVMGGYRILPIEMKPDKLHLTVYRGDYIKFELNHAFRNPALSIPALAIDQKLSNNLAEAPYFKMKKTGTYPFALGAVQGVITVIEYRQPNYREISAKEAAELINNISPLILDVRTPAEYQRGHLNDSVLIPVQNLQRRWKEIGTHKNQDILVYCATGNRSTVASKILIDNGFKRIYNMRYGIVNWNQNNYPVKR